MGIAFTKYVDIQSSVGGQPLVTTRELIGRIFTTNPFVPTNTLVEFSTASEVGDYFGLLSEEYARALFYFGWISKTNRRAKKLGFAFWASVATAPIIYGAKNTYTLAMFTPINAGGMTITLGGVAGVLAALDFSGAASLAAVAAILQVAIRAAHVTALWTAATVVFDATNNRFVVTGGATGACTVSVTDGAQTPAAAFGFTAASAIFSDGVGAQTLTATMDASATASDNFGSFAFTYAAALNLAQVTELATWNAGQNVDYQYCQAVSAANAATWSAALIAIQGCELVLQGVAGEYHEMQPMVILASTVYTERNASQNYMYQMFPTLTPTVSDTTLSNTYDNLRVNYLGVTQKGGNDIAFYQRGTMMGNATAPVDAQIYANEQWLKDAAAVALINLLLRVTKVSVNPSGRALIIGALMAVVDNNMQGSIGAVQNGAISVGKLLTSLQIATITEDSGDPKAWYQVQTIGYWLDVEFNSYTTDDDRTEWEAIYTLIYSKDDSVRKIQGSHVLI